MMACVFQFLIEILFYETSECAIVQFVIPDLARHEVTSANYVIMQAIQQICGSHTRGKDALDAPRYLFVSTNLAQKFPGLLESVIIQSYHSHSPGQFSNVWKGREATGPWWSPMRGTHRSKKFFLTSLLVAWLQKLGALSPTLQRVIIHMLQPMVASGLVLLWFPLQKHPELWSVVGLLALYLGYLVYQNYQADHQSAGVGESPSEVTPLESNKAQTVDFQTPRDAAPPPRSQPHSQSPDHAEEKMHSSVNDSSDNEEDLGDWESDDEDEEASDPEDLDHLFDVYFDPSQNNWSRRDSSMSSSSSRQQEEDDGDDDEESSLKELRLSSQQWNEDSGGSGGQGSTSHSCKPIVFKSSKQGDHNSGSLDSSNGHDLDHESDSQFSEFHEFFEESVSPSGEDSLSVDIRPVAR
jgi:hypothetical protein